MDIISWLRFDLEKKSLFSCVCNTAGGMTHLKHWRALELMARSEWKVDVVELK